MTPSRNRRRFRTELGRRILFCANNSNINGLKHIVRSKSIIVKCLWVLVLAASAGCLALLLAATARGGAGEALSYNPDTRYLRWTTTFPAVTVCEMFYATAAQRKFTQIFGDLTENLSYNYRRYLTNLLYGLGSCTKEVCVPCGSTVPCDVPWRRIIEQIHKSCDELLRSCAFNGAAFPCCALFRAVDAERGACYSFNTLQEKNSTKERLIALNSSTGPGLLSFRLRSDAYISVHSPEELSTNHLDNKFKFDVKTRDGNWVEYLFSVVEMANDPALKFEDVHARGCRYLEEVPASPLHTYPVYSYGACKLAQSTEDSFSECGCVHPARDPTYEDYYCNYTGLNCLVTYEANKQKLGIDSQKYFEPCLPSCSESELTNIHISKKWVPEDAEEGMEVNIRMSSLPHLRHERHLLRSNLDLVVSIGGMVGLLFGVSIQTVVEELYLILQNSY